MLRQPARGRARRGRRLGERLRLPGDRLPARPLPDPARPRAGRVASAIFVGLRPTQPALLPARGAPRRRRSRSRRARIDERDRAPLPERLRRRTIAPAHPGARGARRARGHRAHRDRSLGPAARGGLLPRRALPAAPPAPPRRDGRRGHGRRSSRSRTRRASSTCPSRSSGSRSACCGARAARSCPSLVVHATFNGVTFAAMHPGAGRRGRGRRADRPLAHRRGLRRHAPAPRVRPPPRRARPGRPARAGGRPPMIAPVDDAGPHRPACALSLPGGGLTGALYQIGALAALEDGVRADDGQRFSALHRQLERRVGRRAARGRHPRRPALPRAPRSRRQLLPARSRPPRSGSISTSGAAPSPPACLAARQALSRVLAARRALRRGAPAAFRLGADRPPERLASPRASSRSTATSACSPRSSSAAASPTISARCPARCASPRTTSTRASG